MERRGQAAAEQGEERGEARVRVGGGLGLSRRGKGSRGTWWGSPWPPPWKGGRPPLSPYEGERDRGDGLGCKVSGLRA